MGHTRAKTYACGGGFLAPNRADTLCTEASVSFAFCRSCSLSARVSVLKAARGEGVSGWSDK
jgi:hypothetical protein